MVLRRARKKALAHCTGRLTVELLRKISDTMLLAVTSAAVVAAVGAAGGGSACACVIGVLFGS